MGDPDYRATLLRLALVAFFALYGGQTWRHYQASAMPRLQSEVADLNRQRTEWSEEREQLRSRVSAVEEMSARVAAERDAMTQRNSSLQAQVERLTTELDKAREDVAPLRAKAEERAKKLHASEQKVLEMEKQLAAVERERAGLAQTGTSDPKLRGCQSSSSSLRKTSN